MGWDGPLTHRQFKAWRRFLGDQMNEPNRSDYYAMAVASEVRIFRIALNQMFGGKGDFKDADFEKFKLSWKEISPQEVAARAQLYVEARKAQLLMMGGEVRKVKRSVQMELARKVFSDG